MAGALMSSQPEAPDGEPILLLLKEIDDISNATD
jgi:hypothetical protein